MTEDSKNNLHCTHQSLLKEVCTAALLWICVHFCGPEPEKRMRRKNGTSEFLQPYHLTWWHSHINAKCSITGKLVLSKDMVFFSRMINHLSCFILLYFYSLLQMANCGVTAKSAYNPWWIKTPRNEIVLHQMNMLLWPNILNWALQQQQQQQQQQQHSLKTNHHVLHALQQELDFLIRNIKLCKIHTV